ncbi:permease [Jatrophihabitans endophyticus]|uniref:permease n=1 Tax=Jatrophihabitans endophyticus TaxID=1206085 RepID=UPI0019F94ED1|nr:permease [Jatrophihabitans endophyticus]MBE7189925.1 permease [Jatrophihabitans endophyticus]
MVWHAIWHWLDTTLVMAWQIAWSLILGFALSAVIESLVPKSRIAGLLPDDRPRTLVTATGLGAVASSCSYAATALARSLFRKGANFTAAIAFQIASTNLVIELGIVLALIIGWPFTLAEFVGGPIMIAVVALLIRRLLTPKLIDAARRQAERGLAGSMEGHAAMDMSVPVERGVLRTLVSARGSTAVSETFVMEWASIIRDLGLGLLVAGAASAWIPNAFWSHLFLADHPLLAKAWGPIIGPAVAVATSVCSIGNVTLAAVLWNGGISFGGVTAFLFADLVILPIVVIYRKYYGTAVALRLSALLYLASVVAGYVVELLFEALRLVPTGARHAQDGQTGVHWNYTSVLDIVFGVLAVALVYRFFAVGDGPMLRQMNGSPEGAQHEHAE